MARQDIKFPVGRIVGGDLYNPRKTDSMGQPLKIKNGPQAGQDRVDYYIAYAIPKGPEPHWAHTQWGGVIWQVGAAAFPQAYQSSGMAWKIVDGDSAVPNGKGKIPKDRPGYPGHWVLQMGSGMAPRIYNADGSAPLPQPGAVKPGYWVQIYGNVDDNGSPAKPGVYLNHSMISLQGYDKEIVVGPDAAAVGFGQGVQLPAGVSTTPIGVPGGFPGQMPAAPGFPGQPPAMMPPPGMATPPGFPGQPGAMMASPQMPVAPPTAVLPGAYPPAGPAPTVVQPNPAFLQVPTQGAPALQMPGMPGPAGIAPPPVARRMTPQAQGTYEQYIAAGWTDQSLVQLGLLLA